MHTFFQLDHPALSTGKLVYSLGGAIRHNNRFKVSGSRLKESRTVPPIAKIVTPPPPDLSDPKNRMLLIVAP
jgi:hypothetical protein